MSRKEELSLSKLSDGEVISSSSGEYLKKKISIGGKTSNSSRRYYSGRKNNGKHMSHERSRSPNDRYGPPMRKRRNNSKRYTSASSSPEYYDSGRNAGYNRISDRNSYKTRDGKSNHDSNERNSYNKEHSSLSRQKPDIIDRKDSKHSSYDDKYHSKRHHNGKSISKDRKNDELEVSSSNTKRNGKKINTESLSTKDESSDNLDDLYDKIQNSDDKAEAELEKRRLQRRKILEKYTKHQGSLSSCTNGSVVTNSCEFNNSNRNDSNVTLPSNDEVSLDGSYLTNLSSITKTTTTKVDEKNTPPSSNGICEHLSSEFLKKSQNDTVDDYSFDMFAEELKLENTKRAQQFLPKLETSKLIDNSDDHEGYYKVTIGELMNSRYSVYAQAGKGVFSNVMRARDITKDNKEIAIKMLRNNDLMKRQGLKELDILNKINNADPTGKQHCVQLFHHFKHRNHLCLVFESLYINMRELIKKYGNGIGLNIKAVRTYSYQIFQALKHLKKLSIIHADIKPDNMMVNYQKNQLKLCDFGSACYGDEVEITPYLVSRFYRAPEIILGLNYDFGIDLWSVGCSLFELFTGKILFPARTNNEMLKLFMDLKGKFSHKMIRKSTLRYNHFDDNFNFIFNEYNKITQKDKVTVICNVQAVNDLTVILTKNQNLDSTGKKKVLQLKDLLDKIFTLDPSKRITVAQSIVHPFIVEKCL